MGESRRPCPHCARLPGTQHSDTCKRAQPEVRVRHAARKAQEEIRVAFRDELRREAIVRAALREHQQTTSSRILGPDGKAARKEQP